MLPMRARARLPSETKDSTLTVAEIVVVLGYVVFERFERERTVAHLDDERVTHV